jgi:hypothetical protein
MKGKPRRKPDPIEQEIELAMQPGSFINYRDCFSFVSDLEEVVAKIRDLIRTDPPRAVALFESFLAGCGEKIGELDDSGGDFGQLVEDLICGWTTARQASGADPDQTAATLLGWMDDDPYAFFYGIEKDLVKAFNKAGLAAFEKRVRARFDAAAPAKPLPGKPIGDQPESVRRHWGQFLRTIYFTQKSIPAYLSLTGETGLTPQDCHALATLHAARRKPDQALGWVERGLALCRQAPKEIASFDLTRLQRDLLTKFGRSGDALDLAWSEYQSEPNVYTWEELMKFVPKAGRAGWREKALDAARQADLQSHIELLMQTREIGRLADLIGSTAGDALEQVSHYATEPAARKLEKAHPALAARLWLAQGMRVVDDKKSRYYAAALSNFARARQCFERAGLTAEWQATVSLVRAAHHRKTGFISGFEAVVKGTRKDSAPSFLERAKTRWGQRYGKTPKA